MQFINQKHIGRGGACSSRSNKAVSKKSKSLEHVEFKFDVVRPLSRLRRQLSHRESLFRFALRVKHLESSTTQIPDELRLLAGQSPPHPSCCATHLLLEEKAYPLSRLRRQLSRRETLFRLALRVKHLESSTTQILDELRLLVGQSPPHPSCCATHLLLEEKAYPLSRLRRQLSHRESLFRLILRVAESKPPDFSALTEISIFLNFPPQARTKE